MSAAPQDGTGPRRAAFSFGFERDWPGYFEAVAGQPARETVVDAIARFEGGGAGLRAVDLGCGEGRDTVELLRRGWRVTAIDGHPEALRILEARSDLIGRDRLELVHGQLEDVEIPVAELVSSSFTLPFCPPECFERLWGRLTSAIVPGGRFCGQLFGERDTWASIADRSHHTRSEVEAMLAGFEIELLREDESDAEDATGVRKHWHVYHIVARKPGGAS
ncbi:MAG: class I SAM-dependent methyltransferase [Phycisphaerales bacterium JB039]